MILLKLPEIAPETKFRQQDIDRLLQNLMVQQPGIYQLLYVGAKWCAPCKGLRPVFNALLSGYADITCFEIDLDEEFIYSESSLLRSLPAILLFESGKVTQQLNGLVTTDKIHQLLCAYRNRMGMAQNLGLVSSKLNPQVELIKQINEMITEGKVEEAMAFYQSLGTDVKYQSNLQQIKSLLDLLKESQQQLNNLPMSASLYPVYQLFKQLNIESGLDLLLQISEQELPSQGTNNRQLYVKGLNTLTDKKSAKKYRQQFCYFKNNSSS
jgi:thioredoxin-like negative regulator of GroEL